MLFTSGSTGRPKGVPITHGNVHHYLETIERRYRFTENDVFTQSFEITFDLAMFDLFGAWGSGATVVSAPAYVLRRFPEFAARHGITVWFSTPSTISVLAKARSLTPGALPSLRWSLFCGEPLRLRDAQSWQAAAPNSLVENLYGPRELTISCSVHRYDPDVSPGICVNGILPIGAMHDGMQYLICDDRGSTGMDEGELCVTGPQLFPGYLDPCDDKGRFLSHGSRQWYRTGDRVRRCGTDELAYLGRTDDQVKVRGQRVELAEIDSGLNRCEGVVDGVTVTVEVNGETELFAFYSGSSTRASVEGQLGEFFPPALIPRYVEHLSELPRNSNGKISRMALRTLARDRIGR
ncbi:AMP-binding protein [Streptomyces sp. Wh19]|uniref:AMP-binding protein n=1 Tax=Streptomyces sp. Wh19 TaxID=3076629 RepID=UPI002958A601|nr:AMP-binding protein [Streptomyces sp. Wh19]MDV9194467.1 AMP-binding protein [Streptomyces sp. Wh19]